VKGKRKPVEGTTKRGWKTTK